MKIIDPAQRLVNGRHLALHSDETELLLSIDQQPVANLQMTSDLGSMMGLQLSEINASDNSAIVPVMVLGLQDLFDNRPHLLEVELSLAKYPGLIDALVKDGFAVLSDEIQNAVISRRGMMRQIADLYLPKARNYPFPLQYAITDGKRHPMRPTVASGEVYRRYLPEQGLTLSFHTVDSDADLDVFHAWHNNPRVSAFWELAGSKDMHRDYLQKVTADAHMHPVFGCFDGEPFGYFEIYWAKEDRIAPYYDVDDYDRGVHMLVGEERWRGPHRVAAWLPSLAHFMFLDDPRTRNVVAEPRADNAKMIAYMQQAGFCKPKEFDFPHKRAALMMLSREAFFDQFCV